MYIRSCSKYVKSSRRVAKKTISQVGEWLKHNGLDAYTSAFEAAKVVCAPIFTRSPFPPPVSKLAPLLFFYAGITCVASGRITISRSGGR